MGYYTYFTLEAYEDGRLVSPEKEAAITTALEEIFESGLGEVSSWHSYFYDSMKWYEHDIDMLSLSKKFPEVLFILSGEGEERDDNWITYYKNDEIETCHGRIVFEEPRSAFVRESGVR